jgi:hypothetical protein
VEGCGRRYVVHNFDTELFGTLASEHRTEEDVVEYLTIVGLDVFDFTHNKTN